MKEHLNRISTQQLNVSYCSTNIQDELINLMASIVLEIILIDLQSFR